MRKYIENVTVGAYFEWAQWLVLSYAKAWDISSVHKADTRVRFGNGRGSVLGTSTGFASDAIKQMKG